MGQCRVRPTLSSLGRFMETLESREVGDVRELYVFEASSQSTVLSHHTSWECCECCALVLLQTAGADG